MVKVYKYEIESSNNKKNEHEKVCNVSIGFHDSF